MWTYIVAQHDDTIAVDHCWMSEKYKVHMKNHSNGNSFCEWRGGFDSVLNFGPYPIIALIVIPITIIFHFSTDVIIRCRNPSRLFLGLTSKGTEPSRRRVLLIRAASTDFSEVPNNIGMVYALEVVCNSSNILPWDSFDGILQEPM